MKRTMLTLLAAGAAVASAAWAGQQEKPKQQPAAGGSGTVAAGCQPQTGGSPCNTCHEEKCCQARRACDADPACSRFIECLTSCPSPPCFEKCGKAPETYLARYACQMERCNSPVCGGPVDACTLCMSTRCVKAFVACWGTPACEEYASCVAGCKGNARCGGACKTKYPEGVKAAEEKATCAGKECGSACPSGAPLDERPRR
jgi:hypothetical protein